MDEYDDELREEDDVRLALRRRSERDDDVELDEKYLDRRLR